MQPSKYFKNLEQSVKSLAGSPFISTLKFTESYEEEGLMNIDLNNLIIASIRFIGGNKIMIECSEPLDLGFTFGNTMVYEEEDVETHIEDLVGALGRLEVKLEKLKKYGNEIISSSDHSSILTKDESTGTSIVITLCESGFEICLVYSANSTLDCGVIDYVKSLQSNLGSRLVFKKSESMRDSDRFDRIDF